MASIGLLHEEKETVLRVIQRKQCTSRTVKVADIISTNTNLFQEASRTKLELTIAELASLVAYLNEALKSTLVPKSFCCRVTRLSTAI